jgi:hypothetical protein
VRSNHECESDYTSYQAYFSSNRVFYIFWRAKSEKLSQSGRSKRSHRCIPVPQSDVMQVLSHSLPIHVVPIVSWASHDEISLHGHTSSSIRECYPAHADAVEVGLAQNIDTFGIQPLL